MKIAATIVFKKFTIHINDDHEWPHKEVSISYTKKFKHGYWNRSFGWDKNYGFFDYKTTYLPDDVKLYESRSQKDGKEKFFGWGMQPVQIN